MPKSEGLQLAARRPHSGQVAARFVVNFGVAGGEAGGAAIQTRRAA